MKICVQCNKEFNPSSGHKKCPRCRWQESKLICPACGNLMSKSAKKCTKCTNFSMPLNKNPNWKGGKRVHRRGYIFVRAIDHPRAKRNNGYVFEHILVMEQSLGRYLFDNENIHHINGIKDDNRIENLELWITPQPTGIRVKDAVKWAKHVLEIYSPESLK